MYSPNSGGTVKTPGMGSQLLGVLSKFMGVRSNFMGVWSNFWGVVIVPVAILEKLAPMEDGCFIWLCLNTH